MSTSFALPKIEELQVSTTKFTNIQKKCADMLLDHMRQQSFLEPVSKDPKFKDFLPNYVNFMTSRAVTNQPLLEYAAYGIDAPMMVFYIPSKADDKCFLSIYMTIAPFDFIYMCTEFAKMNVPKHGLATENWQCPSLDLFHNMNQVDRKPLYKKYPFLKRFDEFPGMTKLDMSDYTYEEAMKYHKDLHFREPKRMVFGMGAPMFVGF